MNDLLALAARCEAAEGGEQRELLQLSFDALVPMPDGPQFIGVGLWGAWFDHKQRFAKMLDAEAYESAALTLVPVGYLLRNYAVTRYVPHCCEVSVSYGHGGWLGHSDHSFALALCAAALRTRAA